MSNPIEHSDEHDALALLIGRAGKREPIPELVQRRVQKNVQLAWQQAVQRKRRRPWLQALAATLLCAVGIAIVITNKNVLAPTSVNVGQVAAIEGQPRSNNVVIDRNGATIHAGDTLTTAAGERLNIELTGHRSLRVNENSTVIVGTDGRLKLIAGHLYLDAGTASRVGSAFIVDTPLGKIRDIGTQFSVRVADERMALHVREGQTRFESSGPDIDTIAGNGFDIGASGQLVNLAVAATDPIWHWAQALATAPAIEDMSLNDFLVWVARETGRELHYATASARKQVHTIRLSGDISNLTPEQAIAPVLSTTGIGDRVKVTATMIQVR